MQISGRAKLVCRIEDATYEFGPKTPVFVRRAFYLLFCIRFAKYFIMLTNIHSARMYAAQSLISAHPAIEKYNQISVV